mmetsp:Transcript_61007/g.196540  ORF Transcript_61007/g.196540 Transcript_61007/m.196540 type:complete len:345 (+) Transcript_61007:1134-2168(+)
MGRGCFFRPHDTRGCGAGCWYWLPRSDHHWTVLRARAPLRHDDPGGRDDCLWIPHVLPGRERTLHQRCHIHGFQRVRDRVLRLASLRLPRDHAHCVGDHRVHRKHYHFLPRRCHLCQLGALQVELHQTRRFRLVVPALCLYDHDPCHHDLCPLGATQLGGQPDPLDGGSCHGMERIARRRQPLPGDHCRHGAGYKQAIGLPDNVPRGRRCGTHLPCQRNDCCATPGSPWTHQDLAHEGAYACACCCARLRARHRGLRGALAARRGREVQWGQPTHGAGHGPTATWQREDQPQPRAFSARSTAGIGPALSRSLFASRAEQLLGCNRGRHHPPEPKGRQNPPPFNG